MAKCAQVWPVASFSLAQLLLRPIIKIGGDKLELKNWWSKLLNAERQF
jgi:hypothetical protein